MKKALITGITGQDGAYLSKLLLDKGYRVYGTFRRTSTPNFWRLQTIGVYSKIKLIPADLLDMGSLMEAVKISEPDEVYNLAAQSYIGNAFEQPVGNAEITGLAVTKLLEAVRVYNPKTKFYQASSSEMFGNSGVKSQNENTPFKPASPYAAAKLYAHSITNIYRDAYGMFIIAGILFNHESPLRGLEFVSRKISNGVAKIKLGLDDKLILGNLKAKRDWGYAPEYMEAIHKMLQQNKPESFVIATGESHTVEDFVKLSFEQVGLNWKKYVKSDKRFFRPLDVNYLQGDVNKAKKIINWKPKINFEKLVKMMLEEDLNRWRRFMNGESFPWDAPLYPEESNIITKNSKENKESRSRIIKYKKKISHVNYEF